MPKNINKTKNGDKFGSDNRLLNWKTLNYFIHIYQLIFKILLKQRSLNKIRHYLAGRNQIWHHFFIKKILKAHRQISKKRCFEKYCSCDQACQFSASWGTPWRSYFENLRIDYKFINKRVRLFINQRRCAKKKLLLRHNMVAK